MRCLFAVLLVASCSSPAPGTGQDASPEGSSTDATFGDASTDVATSSDAPPDTPVTPDAGPLGPNPPSGATLCGSGTFTQSDAVATCKQSSLIGGLVTDACGAITMTTGSWQAWCSATSIYMWAEFDGLATTTPTCPMYFLDPDYEYGSGGGTVGSSGGNGYATTPTGEITGMTPINAAIWVTLGNAKVVQGGALYIGTTLDPQCKGASGPDLMLGAALTWK